LAGDAHVVNRGHVNQEASGERDVRSNAGTLLAQGLFGDLYDDFLAFAQEFADAGGGSAFAVGTLRTFRTLSALRTFSSIGTFSPLGSIGTSGAFGTFAAFGPRSALGTRFGDNHDGCGRSYEWGFACGLNTVSHTG